MRIKATWEQKPSPVSVKGAKTTYYKVAKLEVVDASLTAEQLNKFSSEGSGADYAVSVKDLAEIMRKGINALIESRTRSALSAANSGTGFDDNEPEAFEEF